MPCRFVSQQRLQFHGLRNKKGSHAAMLSRSVRSRCSRTVPSGNRRKRGAPCRPGRNSPTSMSVQQLGARAILTHLLRIFGVPPPRNLLQWDFCPQSGRGPDNFRGNIIEGLNMHLAEASGGSAAAADAHSKLQETWILFRTRVEMVAAVLGLQAPIQAWKIVNAALSVPDNALMM